MSAKKKISIRKILQVLVTLVVSAGCIAAIVGASTIEESQVVTRIAVHIQNGKKYQFIEEQQILDLAIHKPGIDIKHTPMARLDIGRMEQALMADPWVADAQVFVDNKYVLHMYVTQRLPVARLFQRNSTYSYYIDSTLSIMPLSPTYKFYTTVVTDVPELSPDSNGLLMKQAIVAIVRTIQADTFWSAQVSQVIVDTANTFQLVPVFGDQRILFGGIDDATQKLGNLFAFYKSVSNVIGWDKYETLDVRFKNQVIASPSLPYKGPEDKAINKMNWINSIVETEARIDTKDSLKLAETRAAQALAEKVVKRKPIEIKARPKHNTSKTPPAAAATSKEKKAAQPKADITKQHQKHTDPKEKTRHEERTTSDKKDKKEPKREIKTTPPNAEKAHSKPAIKHETKAALPIEKKKEAKKDAEAKPTQATPTKKPASVSKAKAPAEHTEKKDKKEGKDKKAEAEDKQPAPKYLYPEKKH